MAARPGDAPSVRPNIENFLRFGKSTLLSKSGRLAAAIPGKSRWMKSPTGRKIGSRKERCSMTETATFAAGCFWGVEEDFRQMNGVVSTKVGYTGGHMQNPTYQDVCTDTTGHAEAVQVTFDPARVSYEALLEKFWSLHNPTTPNRQGPDIGSQYRSAVFYHSPAQEAAARASKERLEKSGRFSRPIVTEIVPAAPFYDAEEYHQQYVQKHGRHCGI
jgi:peptide-methionine (S)-S-oxide reductase